MNASNEPLRPPIDKGRFPYRFPPLLKFSSFVIVVIFLLGLALTLFVLRRQETVLYLERVRTWEVILNHFANNASMPLLADDTLSLNALVKEMPHQEGYLYAIIVDRNGLIKAHTEPEHIGTILQPVSSDEEAFTSGDILQNKYMLQDGSRVLQLTKPVAFNHKEVGSAHLGLSLDFMEGQFQKETFAALGAILPLTLIVVLALIAISVVRNRRFSGSISELVGVTQAIGQGDFAHELKAMRNSELGDLAAAINDMSKQLEKRLSELNASCGPACPDIFKRSLGQTENSWPAAIARSQVTVVFAGIKGFKSHADSSDPGKVLSDLNEYFSIATDAILAHGGSIDKFIGDAVIGVFGGLAAYVNHSERAVRSSVAMLRSLKEASETDNQLLGRVGVGISSGVVLSGSISSKAKMEYVIIGESFKAAYSLNVMAGPGEIVLSKEVYQAVKELIAVEPLPPRQTIKTTGPWENFRLRSILEKEKYG